MEYIFGKNTIESFIDSKNIIEVYIANNFSDEKLLRRIRQSGIKLSVKDKFVTDKYLDKMKYSGIISQDAINKIRNLKYRQKDEKYYTNVFKKNMNNV